MSTKTNQNLVYQLSNKESKNSNDNYLKNLKAAINLTRKAKIKMTLSINLILKSKNNKLLNLLLVIIETINN